VSVPPGSHVVPLQQPEHEVVSQVHAYATHSCPTAHAPFPQRPPQPSLAPHTCPAQLGVHVPAPQTPGTPPPPHDSSAAQPGHSTATSHAFFTSPHLPAQTAVASALHSRLPSVPPSWKLEKLPSLPPSGEPDPQMHARYTPPALHTCTPFDPPEHSQTRLDPAVHVSPSTEPAEPLHAARAAATRMAPMITKCRDT
jgi:hypothetical protein